MCSRGDVCSSSAPGPSAGGMAAAEHSAAATERNREEVKVIGAAPARTEPSDEEAPATEQLMTGRPPRPRTRPNRVRAETPTLPYPKLQILTVGVNAAGLKGFEGEALRLGLEAHAFSLVGQKPVMQLDARVFRDPSRELCGHCGRHPDIIARLVHHSSFPTWLAAAKKEFTGLLGDWGGRRAYRSTICVLVFCRSGRHRSVAASEVLAHVAQHVLGMRCWPIEHLSLRADHCVCAVCARDRPRCDSLTRTMITAVAAWEYAACARNRPRCENLTSGD